MKKRKTNIEIVVDLMKFSEYGAMSQLFIIDAITKHTNMVAELDPEQLEKSGKWELVNPKAWVGVAKEIKRRMEEAYGENDRYEIQKPDKKDSGRRKPDKKRP